MKTASFVTLLLPTLFFSTPGFSATPINGWYTGAFGGYANVPGNVNKTTLGITRSNTTYHSGYDAGASLGFKSNPLRYEGEMTYLKANVDQFKINHVRAVSPIGYSNAAVGLANVYYDFLGLTTPLQPYLGAGIGYAWVQTQLNNAGPITAAHFTGSNSVFAYQATGGVTYNFAENYALNLGYRYIGTAHASELGQLFQAHLANIGAVYRFDGKSYS
ncbi:MAG TPA: porin family protein [Legionella sp.]|nr:porin family protein [Legionella sp.]